ncbi:hypothetical protein M408DRAFT_331076 [Serendipita vermifera MAFF 305830]|uniref:Dynein light intermediate chain n=1 Tax=Serendipita vermifera MAFF 305830 TaxID=933852 RepID=A0A0C2X8C9_SERVB|nr:hypothetical protein M408DRAFT_331076 [Serendipita vermifera MAFF 305830]
MATVTSRPSSPTQDLWSSILDSVSNSKSIPSKQILLLGEPHTGKTTLAAALLKKEVDPDHSKDDFALGFDWADVRDDADEDTLARLSIYTVQSSNPVHTGLVPHVLPPKTSLANTLVMIVLDWTKPWSFVEQLELWLHWVDVWAKGDGNREVDVLRDEGKEKLQYHLQHYTEPTDAPLPMTTAAMASSALPLPKGTFTSNSAGIPIIVVCTRADLIDDNSDIAGGAAGMGGMVKSKGGEWEERTDGVMQVLRTICLKYGAALFYSTQVPSTTLVLRQYALHYLFTPTPPQPAIGSTDIPAPARNPFKFTHPANALDRDKIVIPAGWDSWGKIKILRDEFEPTRWADAWDKDMESFALAPSSQPGNTSKGPALTEATLTPAIPHGARAYFGVLVGSDRGPAPQSLPAIIQPTPEQAFLQQHYETLAKDPATRDPRAAFRQPTVAVDGSSISSTAGGAGGVGVGVVGPLGSSSFSLPSVEKALVEMEGGNDRERERLGERDGRERSGTAARPPVATSGSASRREGRTVPAALQSSAGSTGRPQVSPTNLGTAPRVPGGQTQHEVLHNFFQSLLTSRTGSGSASASAQAGGTGAGATSNAASQNPSADTQTD